MVGMLDTWGYKGEGPVTCVAVCECSMVIIALWDLRLVAKGRRVLWVLDNSASSHALVKGTSSNVHLSRAVELFYMFAYWFKVHVWFEFVDSESNYVGGISRDLAEDAFCKSIQVQPSECQVQAWMWEELLCEVWASFQRAALGD